MIVIQDDLLANSMAYAEQEWWDGCAEAGPASRPGAQFAEDLPNLEVLAFDRDMTALKCSSCNLTSLLDPLVKAYLKA